MHKAIKITRGLVGILGVSLVLLGVTFWTGHLGTLVPLHMGLGIAFVVGLWTLAILCWIAGGPAPLSVATLLWGLVIPAFGYAQYQLLPGPNHWVIRVLHLAIGVAGMGLAGALSKNALARGAWQSHARAMARGR
jgi:uncharacterized membrane protein YczE